MPLPPPALSPPKLSGHTERLSPRELVLYEVEHRRSVGQHVEVSVLRLIAQHQLLA